MKTNFFLIFLISFSLSATITQYEESEEEYKSCSAALIELETRFFDQMKSEFGLLQYSSSNSWQKIIPNVSACLVAHRRATIDEARALHSVVLEKLIAEINSCEKIRPFLETFPVTYRNICVGIYFYNGPQPYTDGTISSIGNRLQFTESDEKKYLSFIVCDPFFETDTTTLLEETREEAIKRNLAANIENPEVHKTTAKEEAIDRFCDNFKDRMYKKHKLRCWSIGGKMSGQIEEFGMHFKVIRRASEEQARALILDITNTLINSINSDESLAPYLVEKPFPIDRLKIFVGFRTKTYGVYWDTTMEDVVLKEGEISYYQNTPAEVAKARTIIPNHTPIYAKETYDEAMKIQREIQQKQFLPRLLSLFRKNHAD
ncbi:MAG: hypothetical protein ChlgKO_02030 [Chlamydiales bacterium]